MNELKIPMAVDADSNVVRPEYSSKDSQYFCPSCGDLLILRQGEINQAHFAHKATDTCSLETVTHKLAKSLIIQSFSNWKHKKGKTPQISRECLHCRTSILEEFPNEADQAIEEVRLDNGFVVDVALLGNNKIIAAVEVRVSHAVDEYKADNIGLPFVEVMGERILENPLLLDPILDRFKPFECQYCLDAIADYNEKIIQISKATDILIPKQNFRAAYNHCWKCETEILLFAWPKDYMHSQTAPEGVDKPKTIQYRYSKTADTSYWVNTCPACNSIQGDFHLYSEPDSPLFGFGCSGNSEEDFKKDMKELALRHYNW